MLEELAQSVANRLSRENQDMAHTLLAVLVIHHASISKILKARREQASTAERENNES